MFVVVICSNLIFAPTLSHATPVNVAVHFFEMRQQFVRQPVGDALRMTSSRTCLPPRYHHRHEAIPGQFLRQTLMEFWHKT